MLALTYPSLPYADFNALAYKVSEQLSDILQFTATGCMDFNSGKWTTSRRRRRSSRSYNTHLRSSDKPDRLPPRHSSPSHQTAWPESEPWYRPPHHLGLQSPPSQSQYAPNFSRHLQSPTAPVNSSGFPEPVESRRRRPRDRDLLLRDGEDVGGNFPSMDVTSLYPQMNPYADRMSTHSAPDELEFHHARSLGHVSDVGYITLSSPDDAPPTSVPRQSTFPPSTARRTHTTTAVRDATFADEEEFNLFAQATTGLGLDEPFSAPLTPTFSTPAPPPPPPPPSMPQYRLQPPATGSPSTPSPFPPVTQHRQQPRPVPFPRSASANIPYLFDENNTITQAIQQLEHLLDEPRTQTAEGQWHQHQHVSPVFEPQTPQTSHAAALEAMISPLEEDFDDELPDYAESQAQAQADQRAEAARRAQELQRRWQLSGSRRPI